MMHTGFFNHPGNWFCGPGAFFPGPLGWLLTLLFWSVIVALAVMFFRALFSGGRKTGNALEILKQRYARGEISKDEYQRMKTELA
jgi:putative membrane protein